MPKCHCGKRATHGLVHRKGLTCNTHKIDGYTNVVNKRCLFDGCEKQRPKYGNINDKKAIYCVNHKRPDDIHLLKPTCKIEGCDITRSFGNPSDKKKLYCTTHKRIGDVDLASKMCIICGTARASYGLAGGKKLYCKPCSPSGSVLTDNKLCEYKGCKKQPAYGSADDGVVRYCSPHKRDGDINLKSKTCEFKGCSTIPNFGILGRNPQYCVIHKSPDMVDVKNKKCEHKECQKQPNFGSPNDGIPIFCIEHKRTGDIDVKHARCAHDGCDTFPTFGGINTTTRLYCVEHKRETDINLNYGLCKYENCDRLAREGSSYCSDHKSHHSIESAVAVEKKCELCGLKWNIPHDKKMCEYCELFVSEKEDRKAPRERKIHDLLKRNGISFIHDMIPAGSCDKYRPDFTINCGTHYVILEIDEKQHDRYQCGCEQGRMINICQDVGGGLPVVFIRYNPDAYSVDGKRCDEKTMVRYDNLIKTVRSCISHIPNNILTVMYLYYDGYDTNVPDIYSVNIDTLEAKKLT